MRAAGRGRGLVVDPRVAVDQVRVADLLWHAALEASEFAPPDPGFAGRVRGVADASEQEAAALRLADTSGVGWNPVPDARRMRLSYELRPGGNRPGPAELWERFDAAVERLGVAMEGVAVSAVARGFGELSEVARAIADELERGAARKAG
jgi:hypothetical protein